MSKLVLALALVAGLSACSQHPTASTTHADSVKAKDIVCRSGYVVTSGRDSVYTGCQPQ